MPTRRFAIERGGAKRLAISWGRGDRTPRVSLDGLELPSTTPGGNEFRLPDGRPLTVDVDSASGDVDVICDGDFLPGTRFDPHHQLLLAYVTLFLVGALHIAAAFLPVAEWFPVAEGVPIGAANLSLAAFYLVAGFAVSRCSRVFLYLSTAAVALEGVTLAIVLFLAGFEHVKLLLLLFLPLAPLVTGISALETISIQEENRPVTPAG